VLANKQQLTRMFQVTTGGFVPTRTRTTGPLRFGSVGSFQIIGLWPPDSVRFGSVFADAVLRGFVWRTVRMVGLISIESEIDCARHNLFVYKSCQPVEAWIAPCVTQTLLHRPSEVPAPVFPPGRGTSAVRVRVSANCGGCLFTCVAVCFAPDASTPVTWL
jgi:hypothetical protein